MNTIFQSIKIFFAKNNKKTFVKRKSKVIIGRALQLDKCEILGDNVPYAVLQHFSSHGAIK